MPLNIFFKHETVKRALEYGTDVIITFGLTMLHLPHIIKEAILPYQKQLNTLNKMLVIFPF